MIRRLLQQIGLVQRGCEHTQMLNTGEQYTDPAHGFTIVTRECRDCGLVIIVQV